MNDLAISLAMLAAFAAGFIVRHIFAIKPDRRFGDEKRLRVGTKGTHAR